MADTTISMYISDISVLLRVSITSRKHAIGIQDKQRCPWPASLNPGRNLSIHPDQAVLPMPPTCMMREGNPDRQTKHPREINTGVSGRGLERRYVVEKIPSMLWGAYMISGHSNAYPPSEWDRVILISHATSDTTAYQDGVRGRRSHPNDIIKP